jgi:hypothetical protein
MDTDDILLWCFLQNYHLDKSNACVHCAPVRFSPLTFRIYEKLVQVWLAVGEKFTVEMAEVRDHLGKYEEDQGR